MFFVTKKFRDNFVWTPCILGEILLEQTAPDEALQFSGHLEVLIIFLILNIQTALKCTYADQELIICMWRRVINPEGSSNVLNLPNLKQRRYHDVKLNIFYDGFQRFVEKNFTLQKEMEGCLLLFSALGSIRPGVF